MRRWSIAVLVLLGVAGLSFVAGCGGSDDGSGSEADVGGVEPEEREGGEDEPAAAEGADVRPYVDALLADHAAAVNEITADPAVARDPDSEAVRRYVELYEPDSTYPDETLTSWVAMADAGQRVQPLDPGTPPTVLDLDGEVEVVSADEVRVPLCVRQQFQVVGLDGRPTQEPTTAQVPGQGVLVRVEGRWVVRQLDMYDEGACYTVVVTGEQEGES